MWFRKRYVFLIFGAGFFFILLRILPKEESMLQQSSYTEIMINLQVVENVKENLESEISVNVSENEFLSLFGYFTTAMNKSLFLLDKDLVDCIDHFVTCAMEAQETKGYLLFGYFTEIWAPDFFPPKGWILESLKGSTIILVSQAIKVVLIFMDDQKDYWFLSGCPEVGFPTSALVKSQNLITVNIEGSQLTQLYLANCSKKLFKRELSSMRLLSCNKKVAAEVRKNHPEYFGKSTRKIKDSLVNDLAYLRDILLSIDMPVFLMCGTLLGWYRECGIISYTSDMDVCAQISHYDARIESLLRQDKRLKIIWRLGKPEDSLEYSVYAGKIKFDLFFLYQTPNSSNMSWMGGMMTNGTKLRWVYPILDEVCSAVLKNRLFHVPCNVEAFLEADHGKNWHIPLHQKNYIWYKSNHNVEQVGVWTSKEWPSVYKVY